MRIPQDSKRDLKPAYLWLHGYSSEYRFGSFFFFQQMLKAKKFYPCEAFCSVRKVRRKCCTTKGEIPSFTFCHLLLSVGGCVARFVSFKIIECPKTKGTS